MHSILELNPETYQRHRIHSQERDWAETNCYVDIWIELLHAMGYEPVAAMPFTVAIDFEGDQWTFFKFPLQDLYELYGLDVQELAVWQPLTQHIEQQLTMGRPVLVELDSCYLPDTAGMAYKLAHVKTTVAVNTIDIDKQQLGYFHGQGYYELSGDDFIDIFRLRHEPDPSVLSPYVEIVKSANKKSLNATEQLHISKQLLSRQVRQMPEINPFDVFKAKMHSDLDWLMQQDIEVFHQYSFATLRQFGACYELAGQYLSWLIEQGETGLDPAASGFRAISEAAKVYQFQLARAMNRKKPLDTSPIDQMAKHWLQARDCLASQSL